MFFTLSIPAAGMGRAVFVTPRGYESEFRERVECRYEQRGEVAP